MDVPVGSHFGRNPTFEGLADGKLQWIQQAGVGYLEVRGEHYDEAYFFNYRRLADTKMGRALNHFRLELVEAYCSPDRLLLDVGIGDGTFLSLHNGPRQNGRGFDVNPYGIAWLNQQGLWGDLYGQDWPYATFWDSLEHIRDPSLALAQVDRVAIVSMPIFRGLDHILSSKHLKPSEHYWYFTRAGFLSFIEGQGFEVLHWSNGETLIGREDIETFVLKRRHA